MKKLFGFLFMAGLLLVAGVAVAQGDSTATAPAEDGGWLSGLLSWRTIGEIALALFGGWLIYRAEKVKEALNEIIVAAQDGKVTEDEFQSIVAKVKAIWGKKEG